MHGSDFVLFLLQSVSIIAEIGIEAKDGTKRKWPEKVLYSSPRRLIFGEQGEDLYGSKCVDFKAQILCSFGENSLKTWHVWDFPIFRILGIPDSKTRLAAKQRWMPS